VEGKMKKEKIKEINEAWCKVIEDCLSQFGFEKHLEVFKKMSSDNRYVVVWLVVCHVSREIAEYTAKWLRV